MLELPLIHGRWRQPLKLMDTKVTLIRGNLELISLRKTKNCEY